MTNMSNKMLHAEKGQRLKQLAKENGLTRDEMGIILNFSPGHITRFYNGEYELPEDSAEKLSKLWGIRKEYIQCIDDFRTDEEIYKYSNETSIKEMQAAINYLETLGLVLRPCTLLCCPVTALYKKLGEISDYVNESEMTRLRSRFDFELPSKDFYTKYFSEWCDIELAAPLPDVPFLDMANVSKQANIDTDKEIYCGEPRGKIIGANYSVTLAFRVYYNKKWIGQIDVNGLQEFIKELDAFTKCTIETLFPRRAVRYLMGSDVPLDMQTRKPRQ